MFEIRVADNFHYMDASETHTHGEFPTWPLAVDAARQIVERCLAEYYKPGMAAAELYSQYMAFGDDPYISPVPAGEKLFSAWTYAKDRCEVLCGSRNGDSDRVE